MELYPDNTQTIESIIRTHVDKRGGYLCLHDCDKLRISPMQIYWLMKKGSLTRQAPGIFKLTHAEEDEFYLLSLRFPKLVYSHETALYLLGYSDQPPFCLNVTVPRGFHSPVLASLSKVHQVRAAIIKSGIEIVRTMVDNPVPVYCIERTLCELLHAPANLNKQIFLPALHQYIRSKQRDNLKLMEFAALFRVEKQMLTYLEIAT